MANEKQRESAPDVAGRSDVHGADEPSQPGRLRRWFSRDRAKSLEIRRMTEAEKARGRGDIRQQGFQGTANQPFSQM